MTARTRGIFRISTTVGLRGFSSSSLYQAGTEICWAVKEHSQTAFARNPLLNARAKNHRSSPLSSEAFRNFPFAKKKGAKKNAIDFEIPVYRHRVVVSIAA